MNCCQCQGLEDLFNGPLAAKELAEYRLKGPAKTTRWLVEAIKAEGVAEMRLLDIGGGVGAIQHALIEAGAKAATDVDASQAYIRAASDEAERRGIAGRILFLHGDFVDLAPNIPPAEIVTLDRVLCCYHDLENLVELSAARAARLYGLVYVRDTWLLRLGTLILNLIYRLQKSSYQSFVHSTQAVDAIVRGHGFTRRFYRQTWIWQVVVYGR